ncbi:MAG: hypothetical protein ABH877_05925 [bacterium]
MTDTERTQRALHNLVRAYLALAEIRDEALIPGLALEVGRAINAVGAVGLMVSESFNPRKEPQT